MLDKYTLYKNRQFIEEKFREMRVDIREVYFGGRWVIDWPDKPLKLYSPYKIDFASISQALANRLSAKVTTATKKPRYCLEWSKIMEIGLRQEQVAQRIVSKFADLYSFIADYPDSWDLASQLVDYNLELYPDEEASLQFFMVDIGIHWHDLIGKRPYLNNNIYTALADKITAKASPQITMEACKKIINYGIHWNPQMAASNDHLIVMRCLLKKTQLKSQLNTLYDYYGSLCLHTAVFSRHTEMVKLLLEAGADPEAVNKQCADAFEMERMMPDPEIRQLLEDYATGCKWNQLENQFQDFLRENPSFLTSGKARNFLKETFFRDD